MRPWARYDHDVIELVEIRRLARRGDAEALALVLTAMGIPSQIVVAEGTLRLCVPATERQRAEAELTLYDQENTPRELVEPNRRSFLAGFDAALIFCAILLFFFAADQSRFLSLDWGAMGAAQAGLIRNGAWWRALTSLTLHADGQHLLGNIGFGTTFGMMASQTLGPGLAALAILLAGGLGNLLNALLQAPSHTAVGSSTAVFGALGILSGHLRGSRPVPWRGGIRHWAPIAGGVLLLVFVGTGGERTDIGAHLAGFAIGCLFGLLLAHTRDVIPAGQTAQRLYGLTAMALLALAWFAAVAAAPR